MLCFKRLLSVTLGSIIVHSVAVADGFQLDFDRTFSGSAPSSPSSPWADARFQNVTPGTVQITVSNLSLTGTENVDELYFNLAPTLNPLNLNFTLISSSG